jgi:hypothetical protein
VGNKDVAESLSKFAASKKVNLVNADGTPFVDLKAAPEGVTAQSIFENYIKALGGKEALAAVKSYEQIGEMKMGPMTAQMNVKVKDNAKMAMSVTMTGMELMKQIYDGTSGVSMQMGQKKPMEQSDITDAKVQMDLMAELNYEKYGIKASLKGVGKVDEEDAYVIELTKADGEVSTDYYSVNTGLKLMSVTTESEGEEPVMAETRYVEYAAVSGIKYASKTKQSVGPQEMEFIYSEMKINPKLNDKDFAVEK